MEIPNPYESQKKLRAYKNKDGTFSLHGPTYSIKDEIKKLGGQWDGVVWNVSETCILSLKPLLMIKIKLDKHCHEEELTTYATHKEVNCGYKIEGCSRCDTPASCGKEVKILEVIDKDIEELSKKYGNS